jgi:hypothetical protein
MKDKPGIFRLAFEDNFHKIDWEDEATFRTPFPPVKKKHIPSFGDLCITAWSDLLYLLPEEPFGLLWPQLEGDLQDIVKQTRPKLTIIEAHQEEWDDLTFVGRAGLPLAVAAVNNNLNDIWRKQRIRVRNTIGNGTSCIHWKKENDVDMAESQPPAELALQERYNHNIMQLKTQKQLYWLAVDQMVPLRHNFRETLTEDYAQCWKTLDNLKIHTQSVMEAFSWRSMHGKLYARKDLKLYKFISDPTVCTAMRTNRQ